MAAREGEVRELQGRVLLAHSRGDHREAMKARRSLVHLMLGAYGAPAVRTAAARRTRLDRFLRDHEHVLDGPLLDDLIAALDPRTRRFQ